MQKKNVFSNNRKYSNYIDYLNNAITIPNIKPYRAIDLFAGCGGLSLGFEAAGIKTTGYEMIENYCMTYKKNLKSECINEKLTKDTVFPEADILIGGPPCQPFSRFGKQLGKNDLRNGFPVFIEAVKKVRPKIFVCENVKGLPEQNKEYFESVISEFVSLGYIIDYKIFHLVQYDVPQNRERLVIVGHHGDFNFPEPNDYVITSGEALGSLAFEIPKNAAFLTPAMDEYIAKYEKASKCKNPRDMNLDKPARTLTCRNLAGATSDMQRIKLSDGRRRRISVREAARLQSFPDWFEFCGSEESQFTQIGNAVPPMFAYKLAKSVIEYIEKLYAAKADTENINETVA